MGAPWCDASGCLEPGAGGRQRPDHRRRIRDLERHTQAVARATVGLDPVDEVDLRGIGQLERRLAGGEDHDPSLTLALIRLPLDESEFVAVEGQRLVEVLGAHDQPQLANGS